MKKLVSLSVVGLLIGSLALGCLNETQKDVLEQIANATNVSYSELLSIFELLCTFNESSRITSLDSKISLVNETYFNKTKELSSELTTLRNDVNETIEEKLAIYDWNFSQLKTDLKDVRLRMDKMNDNFTSSVNEAKNKLTDLFDDKLSEFRKEFVKRRDLDELKDNITSWVYSYVEERTSFYDRMGFYLIVGISIALLGGALILKHFKPSLSIPLLKKVRVEKRTLSDLTTESDLRQRIKKLREFRLKIARSDLTKEQKIELMRKLERGEIELDEEALNKEIEIIKLMEGKRCSKKRKKEKKKQ